jgi:hypothetical protein
MPANEKKTQWLPKTQIAITKVKLVKLEIKKRFSMQADIENFFVKN